MRPECMFLFVLLCIYNFSLIGVQHHVLFISFSTFSLNYMIYYSCIYKEYSWANPVLGERGKAKCELDGSAIDVLRDLSLFLSVAVSEYF